MESIDTNYKFSIPLSKHIVDDIPSYKTTISALKVLKKSKIAYAPFETGNLYNSIKIISSDIDNGKLTIYIDTDYYKGWSKGDYVPYFAYLNEDKNKHYRSGARVNESTHGWWQRLCKDFSDGWKVRADALENYQRKENDTNASPSEHRKLVENDQVRKLRTQEVTKDQIINEVANVTQEEVNEYKATHKALRKLTYERKLYIEPTNIPIIRMSVGDLQLMSAENLQYLLQKELGVDITIGYAHNKRQFHKIKRELLDISRELGGITIGGIPTRTIIRELIRKLLNSEQMNAY